MDQEREVGAFEDGTVMFILLPLARNHHSPTPTLQTWYFSEENFQRAEFYMSV